MVLRALRRLPVTKDTGEILEFINRELVPYLDSIAKELDTVNKAISASLTVGGMFFNGNLTPTTFADSVNFFPILGTTESLDSIGMAMTDSNEVTVNSTDPGLAIFSVTISASKTGATVDYDFAVFIERNAALTQIGPHIPAEITNTIVTVPLVTGGGLENGDKVSVRVRNTTNTNSLTVDTLSVTIKEG